MSDVGKAVFLSHASQDAETATRTVAISSAARWTIVGGAAGGCWDCFVAALLAMTCGGCEVEGGAGGKWPR